MSGTILATITCIYSWYRVLPSHFRGLGATEAQVGLAFMILAMMNRIPQILGGFLADRFGRKRILVAATFLMAPMYALTALTTTWTQALFALGLCWFFSALLGPSITTIVADSVPEDRRGRAIGTVETCVMVAVCAGPWVGGRIIDAVGDFRKAMPLMLAGTAAVYVAVGTIRGLFLVETHASREGFDRRGARLGSLWLIAIVATLCAAAFFLSTDGPFFALYAKDVIHLHESGINDMAFFGGLAALAMALVGGRIVDRIGSARALVAAFAAISVLLSPFAWAWWHRTPLSATAPGLDYLLVVLVFAPGELFSIAYQKLLTSSAPKGHRALHVGLVATATGIFASVANLVGGRLYGAQGPSAPFALGAACAALGTLLAAALWWKSRRPVVQVAQA